MQTPTQSLISYSALERAFSPERLRAYVDPMHPDHHTTVARYAWNLALVNAIQPMLHSLEIAFRNEMSRGAGRIIANRKFQTAGVHSWLDATPTMLMDHEWRKVLKAKERLGAGAPERTESRLIANLDFGFWVALCRESYSDTRSEGPRLWPRLLDVSFQKRPPNVTTRAEIYHRFDRIRKFRNRVAHHQSVWNQSYLAQHDYILESLAWISPKLADALREVSPAPAVFRGGPAAYREYADQLLGSAGMNPP